MRYITLFIILLLASKQSKLFSQQYYIEKYNNIELTLSGADHFAALPFSCIEKKYPFKPWYTINDSTAELMPHKLHPAFCGCFDWHSSVHGHWLLVALLQKYPNISKADSIKRVLNIHFSADNIKTELSIFKGDNKIFERPYGWAWLLQLQNELATATFKEAKLWQSNIKPLSDSIAKMFIPFLRKLDYPIREPEHYNLAFSLCLAWDYAQTANDTSLQNEIKIAAKRLYSNDVNCPCEYEPGGFDFLSPCLEEADLMQRILSKEDFDIWLKKFMPLLYSEPNQLFKVGVVSDPLDGKLVHLYGLNLSRAWCLWNISNKMSSNNKEVKDLALEHFKYSFPNIASGNYMGKHWLATYAYYALLHLN